VGARRATTLAQQGAATIRHVQVWTEPLWRQTRVRNTAERRVPIDGRVFSRVRPHAPDCEVDVAILQDLTLTAYCSYPICTSAPEADGAPLTRCRRTMLPVRPAATSSPRAMRRAPFSCPSRHTFDTDRTSASPCTTDDRSTRRRRIRSTRMPRPRFSTTMRSATRYVLSYSKGGPKTSGVCILRQRRRLPAFGLDPARTSTATWTCAAHKP
jgi:hypothetical protein